jgi:TonB family protein
MEGGKSQEQKPGVLQKLKAGARWLLFVLLVFGLQVALILLLNDERKASLRKTVPGPRLGFATGARDLLELNDPTVFALPHRRGFSGEAWLRKTPPPEHWFEWSEEPRWLQPQAENLGRVPSQTVEAGQFDMVELLGGRAPRPIASAFSPPSLFRQRSELRLEGDLATRQLLSKPPLPDWPYLENFTNTIVGLRVDRDGMVTSTRLLVSSRSRETDQFALAAARSAQFAPLPPSTDSPDKAMRSMTGELVFLWHTVPGEETNNAAGAK